MATQAILGDFRLALVGLGSKVHNPSSPKLGKMFTQVVDTLFDSLLQSKERWNRDLIKVETPPVYGRVPSLPAPQAIAHRLSGFKATGRSGVHFQPEFDFANFASRNGGADTGNVSSSSLSTL